MSEIPEVSEGTPEGAIVVMDLSIKVFMSPEDGNLIHAVNVEDPSRPETLPPLLVTMGALRMSESSILHIYANSEDAEE